MPAGTSGATARRSTAVVALEPDDYSVDRFGRTGASVRCDGRAFAVFLMRASCI